MTNNAIRSPSAKSILSFALVLSNKEQFWDLNNCSLDRILVGSHGYFLGSVEIRLMAFFTKVQIQARDNSLIKQRIKYRVSQ